MPRSAGWYVVQVRSGQERAMCHLIRRSCSEAARAGEASVPLDECFTPRFRTRHKFGGEWRDVEKLLLPGYVIAVTSEPAALMRRLRSIPDLTRLLTMGETFVPLRDDERVWVDEFTRRGDRVVPMSMAHREGGRLVVTAGPLKGREGMITRVNRKKCLAFVEMHVGGKRITTTVGLGIVPGNDSGRDGGR